MSAFAHLVVGFDESRDAVLIMVNLPLALTHRHLCGLMTMTLLNMIVVPTLYMEVCRAVTGPTGD